MSREAAAGDIATEFLSAVVISAAAALTELADSDPLGLSDPHKVPDKTLRDAATLGRHIEALTALHAEAHRTVTLRKSFATAERALGRLVPHSATAERFMSARSELADRLAAGASTWYQDTKSLRAEYMSLMAELSQGGESAQRRLALRQARQEASEALDAEVSVCGKALAARGLLTASRTQRGDRRAETLLGRDKAEMVASQALQASLPEWPVRECYALTALDEMLRVLPDAEHYPATVLPSDAELAEMSAAASSHDPLGPYSSQWQTDLCARKAAAVVLAGIFASGHTAKASA